MPVKFDNEDFSAAARQLRPDTSSAALNLPKTPYPAGQEWKQSEQFRVRVISARTKLKLMRDRSEALQESLQRFRSQQRNVMSA